MTACATKQLANEKIMNDDKINLLMMIYIYELVKFYVIRCDAGYFFWEN